ncbi:anaerobic ribonucleoside-triphosphate reductase activating protein [Lamprobacter modestohalophilus]|uniref:anaerobic ribonucleoside-triphosphate reductase activating protein n=1 Tax=Lamprobacter modestohalophilus TaxID=1064514 RepID=UPI002ADECDC8|nr:anaerobic ribonucleoside-triphosphate reductase activating protein [Lamprobacter modestohalophilus]MEA1051075.1 anaerobic ribonucleoside-triphosphate reductase activating protein [Lamprobacter modestohalophilus]
MIKPKLQSVSTRLRLGGLTPLTSVDYPGELAAVIYCQGCPWRCPYCHNGHLLDAAPEAEAESEGEGEGEGASEEIGQDAITWSEVLELLRTRRGLLDAVVFSGGEPTAQSALADAMAEVKALGFKVGLHTGGPYPQRLRALLPLLDWVGLDIKALPEDYPQVTGVPGSGEQAWQSLALLLDAKVSLEVRTTPMPGLDDDAYLSRLMHKLAEAGVTHYALQQAQSAHLLEPALRHQLRHFSKHALSNAAGLEDPEGGLPNPFPHFELRAA